MLLDLSLVGFLTNVNRLAVKNLEQVPIRQTSLPLKIAVLMTNTFELADAYQAHNDPADPGSDVREEALDSDDDEENDTCSSCVALDDVCFRGS